jgi:hypothetical protein
VCGACGCDCGCVECIWCVRGVCMCVCARGSSEGRKRDTAEGKTEHPSHRDTYRECVEECSELALVLVHELHDAR